MGRFAWLIQVSPVSSLGPLKRRARVSALEDRMTDPEDQSQRLEDPKLALKMEKETASQEMKVAPTSRNLGPPHGEPSTLAQ